MPEFDQTTQYLTEDAPVDAGSQITVGYSVSSATPQTIQPIQPTQPDLSLLRGVQKPLIDAAFGATMAAGFQSSADGTARTYVCNAQTIGDLTAARTIAQADYPGAGIEAELIDGSWVTLDYAQMQVLSSDMQNFYLPLRSKRIGYLKAIATATTVAEVQAVVWQ